MINNYINNNVTKQCKQCNAVKELKDFYKARTNGDGLEHKCKQCYAIKQKAYRATHREDKLKHAKGRRAKYKTMFVEQAGGKCIICGYDNCIDALEFHHIDPSTKSFDISKGFNGKSTDDLLKEIKKCAVLCCICHREVHAGLLDLSVAIPST